MSDIMLNRRWAREPQVYLTKRIKRRIKINQMRKNGTLRGGSSGKHSTKQTMLIAIEKYRAETKKATNREQRKLAKKMKRIQKKG
jgi:hypothetical protein